MPLSQINPICSQNAASHASRQNGLTGVSYAGNVPVGLCCRHRARAMPPSPLEIIWSIANDDRTFLRSGRVEALGDARLQLHFPVSLMLPGKSEQLLALTSVIRIDFSFPARHASIAASERTNTGSSRRQRFNRRSRARIVSCLPVARDTSSHRHHG
jgi:hypothetical protein